MKVFTWSLCFAVLAGVVLSAPVQAREVRPIESLTPEEARRLLPAGELALDGLTTLSAEVAEVLAESRSELHLDGLTTLSVEAAAALARHAGPVLSLDGLTTLSAEAAAALAEHRGEQLYLNGLTGLADETVVTLAGHRGKYLSLDGLTRLSGETAKALAERQGGISFDGVTTLTVEAAKALASARTWDGHLPSLTAFEAPESVEIAAALATRKRLLRLPNLVKISPRTFAALIAKRDVTIPLVETLDFIPEPDGSGNDDFVVPAWLEKRQEEQRAEQQRFGRERGF